MSNDAAAEAVAAVARVLRRQNVSWYLLGAQAVIYWGRPRLSADVDVSVSFPLDRVSDLAAALAEEGFRPLVEDVDEFVARTRVLPLGHEGTGMPIDMIFGGPGLEDEFRERAIPVAIGGETVPIITPEDLLVTKILAGRPKDIEDARGLIAVRGAALDLERVRSLLGLLEAALSRSDLLRELDRLVGEAL